jgi:CRISPR/Cas system-associated endonuclease Cas1
MLSRHYFIIDYPASLKVRNGALDVNGSRFYPRDYPFHTIVLAGPGFMVTSEAIRWIARQHVSLFICPSSAEIFSVIGHAPEANAGRAALLAKRRQFAAAMNKTKRLKIAKEISLLKLSSLLLGRGASEFRQEILQARTITDLMTAEARAWPHISFAIVATQ